MPSWPPLEQAFVPRPRLVAALERAHRRKVVLCVAPAGWGKSALLEEFARSRPERIAFCRVHRNAADLTALVRGVATAIAPYCRGAALAFDAALERVSALPNRGHALALWLVRHLDAEPLVLVADGLGDFVDDEESVSFLATLAERAGTLRLVLAARSIGRLPLGAWMSDGLLEVPIDERALRFEAEETAQYFVRHDAPLVVDVIQRNVDGWPVGVAAAAAFLDPEVRYDSLDPQASFDRLIARAVESVGPMERALLLDCALLPEKDADALESIGWRNGCAILRDLARRLPFLFSSLQPLHFHDRLSALLLERLSTLGREAFDVAVARTGHALEQTGRIRDALDLYTQWQLDAPLATLLATHGLALSENGGDEALRKALERVRDHSSAQGPAILALLAAEESRNGRYDMAESCYLNALEPANGRERDEVLYAYACDLLRRGREDALELLELLLANSALEKPLEIAARSAFAEALLARGRQREAQEHTSLALRALSEVSDKALHARCIARAAYVALYSGELYRAQTLAEEALRISTLHDLYLPAIGALSVLYNVDYELDAPDRALQRLRDLGERAAAIAHIDFQLYALVGALELVIESDNTAAIEQLEGVLASFDLHYDAATSVDGLLPAKAMQLAITGDFVQAHQLLDGTADQQEGSARCTRRALLAFYAAAAGNIAIARRELDVAEELLPMCEPGNHRTVRTYVWISLAEGLCGEIEQGRRYLIAARRHASELPRMRVLVRAVNQVLLRWQGVRNHSLMSAAMLALRFTHFGGVARLLQRLPLERVVRLRMRKMRDGGARIDAGLIHLLERYRSVELC